MGLTNEIVNNLRSEIENWRLEDAKAAKEHRKAMMILELAITGSAASFSPSTDNLSPELKKLVEAIKSEMAESEKNTLSPATLRGLISSNVDSPDLQYQLNSILDDLEAKQTELSHKGIKFDQADSFVQLQRQEDQHQSVWSKAINALDLNLAADMREILSIVA